MQGGAYGNAPDSVPAMICTIPGERSGKITGVELAADAGEEEAFSEFYRAHYGAVVAQVYGLTGDLGEAQDVAQEAFARLWDRWSKVTAYDKPLAWVRLVAQRIAVSRWRRAAAALRSWKRHGVAPDTPGPSPDTVAVIAALRLIPESQRRAIVMHHLGGQSVAEIAAAEGTPEGTIKARLARGRRALAQHLRDGQEAETCA